MHKCRREILLHEDKTVRYERLLTKVVGNNLKTATPDASCPELTFED